MLLEGLICVVNASLWVVEFLVRGLVGWRFLVSPRYRRTVAARWKDLPSSVIALEVSGAAVGVFASAVLLVWLLAGLAW